MATRTALPSGTEEVSRAHTTDLQEQKVAMAPKRRKTSPKKMENEGLLATLGTLMCDHQIGMQSQES
jgi:acyl-CoA-dependent ceramide synthase